MWPILRCSGLVIFASAFVLRASDAHAERPDRDDFASIRAWVEGQPRSFENEILFTVKDGQIVRSERFTTAGAIFGDFDGDGDIDRYDYTALQICLSFSGPDIPTPPACYVFDFDEDRDIDMEDVAGFNLAWTGPLGGVLVEAGSLFPALASPDGYYSGENNSLRGIARQAGYTQDDLWYAWSLIGQPAESGEVIIANRSVSRTPYFVLPPFVVGEYGFKLTVTNLITGESGFDMTALRSIECFQSPECDDGAFCNGAEICDLNAGRCAPGTAPCSKDQVCDEWDRVCRQRCTTDADCDDADLCTVDACTNNGCQNTPVDCNDGLFCNGTEFCDSWDGSCASYGNPCADGEVCHEDTHSCSTPPWYLFRDGSSGATCGIVNAANAKLVLLTATNQLSLVTGTDVTLQDSQVDADGFVTFEGNPAGAIGFATDGDGKRTVWWMSLTGTVVNVNGFTGEPTQTSKLPSDFVDVACDACQFWDDPIQACGSACDVSTDCDDADACTDDACVNNGCENTPVDCDDSVPCTDDSCDAGMCVNTDNCTAPETCNLTTGLCEGTICTTDADCEDWVFCNGDALCDTTTGDCRAGSDPCPACTTCAEGDTGPVCTPPTFFFTLSQDILVGTTCDDLFYAPLIFNPGTGSQVASLQTADSANGLAGNDTLNATFAGFAMTVVPLSLVGIETLNLTAFAATTVNATGISGLDTINSTNSVAALTVTGLQELADFGFSGVNDATVGMNLTFATAAVTSGSTDTITGTLTGSTVGTVAITTAATNGFETLALVSSGSSANTLASVTQTTGTSMATLNLSGAQALTLSAIPSTILTVNGATMTGALQLGTGTSTANYAAFSTANMNNITSGTGNDTFIFGATFDGNDFDALGEGLNGGTGTDVFQASFGATIGTGLRLSGIEELRFNATASGVSVNLTGVTGLTTASIEGDGTSNTLTLLNISGSPLPTLQFRGNGTQAAQSYDGVLYQATGVTGSNDSLTVTVGNRGTALNASGTTNAHAVGNLQLPGIENVTLNVSDGPGVFNGLGASSLVTLSVTGSSNVTLGTVDVGASTIVQLYAGNVSGNFAAWTDDLASGALVTLGSGNDTFSADLSSGSNITISAGPGNDTITGSGQADIINGGAGNDTLVGGSGNDTINGGNDNDVINGGPGNDVVTGGMGSDSFLYDQSTSNNRSDVTDFATGAGGDTLRFDVSALGLTNQTEYVGSIGGIGSESLVILTGGGFANDAAAEAAVNADSALGDAQKYVCLYFNTTDFSTHIMYDPDADTDGGAILLGRLINLTSQGAHDALTAANLDTQP